MSGIISFLTSYYNVKILAAYGTVGSGTVGSGISSNLFSVSEQRSMLEYGYGFFYNLLLYCLLILEVYTVLGVGFWGGPESGSGCGTRIVSKLVIFFHREQDASQ